MGLFVKGVFKGVLRGSYPFSKPCLRKKIGKDREEAFFRPDEGLDNAFLGLMQLFEGLMACLS